MAPRVPPKYELFPLISLYAVDFQLKPNLINIVMRGVVIMSIKLIRSTLMNNCEGQGCIIAINGRMRHKETTVS